ncbi:MAG: SDR family NAD(P)-dependent oxidoreductase [Uliginosibacterium sp.]|jgi:decaprenylphospho-beta-D-erythro-pentofuranosid-2-ulose 2-reductase|nr:SDR family NAD(P)-dependent oxidoreductase [Uliginosibacterium sp.]
MRKKRVIIGATSAIAEQCARLWVSDAAELTLVGRDLARLERQAADLRVRNPAVVIRVLTVDFMDASAISSLAEDVVQRSEGGIDSVLIAHGSLPDQGSCEKDLVACRVALAINALSPVLFAEAFAGHFAVAGKGTLGLIGSVAGDRGRKSNYVYGAAKGLVDRYMEGLQHRFAASAVRAVLVKPGPTDTPMTAHLKAKGMKLADPGNVASAIVSGMARGCAVVYAPAKWRLIMLVIRHLPRMVFNRMDI